MARYLVDELPAAADAAFRRAEQGVDVIEVPTVAVSEAIWTAVNKQEIAGVEVDTTPSAVLRGLVNNCLIHTPADEQDLAVCESLIDHHFTTHCSLRTIGCGALKQSSRTTRSLPARPRSGANWSGNHGRGQLATGPARRAGRRTRRCTGTRSTRPVQFPRHRLRSPRPSRTRWRGADAVRASTARGRACVLGRRRRRLEIYEQMCPSPCFNLRGPAPGTG